MKFVIALVSYLESLGYDTSSLRKSADGSKAIVHMQYAEILSKNLDTNANVTIYDRVNPDFQALLASDEWNGNVTGTPNSFGDLAELAKYEARLTAQVTEAKTDMDNFQTEIAGEVTTAKEDLNAIVDNYQVTVNQQLEQTVNYSGREVTTRFENEIKPIVTFVSDDGDLKDYDVAVKSLFLNNGMPCVIAAVPGRIANAEVNTMSYAQLRDLQDNYNYEIASHTYNHYQLTTLTDAEIEYELGESYRVLTAEGLKCKNLCIPYGFYDNRVKKIAQKYYRGVRESGAQINPYPISNLAIKSYSTEFDDLVAAKAKVDEAVANKKWLVFLFHAWSFKTNPEYLQNLSDLMDYIKTKTVDVVTLDEGMNRHANLIEVGANAEFRVSPDGMVTSNQINSVLLAQNAVTATTPITDFKAETLSMCNISLAGATGFPENKAGMLYTHRFRAQDYGYQFQEYHLSNSHSIYKRYITLAGAWSAWEVISLSKYKMIFKDDLPVSHTLDDLTDKFINIAIYTTARATGMPENKAGILTAYAFSYGTDKTYYFERYKIYNSPNEYTRYALTNGAWSTWINPNDPSLQNVLISAMNAYTATSVVTDFPDNKITHTKITTVNAAGFPDGVAGMLITHRLGGGDLAFNYQIYHKYNSVDTHKRISNASGVWQSWVKYTTV